MASEWEELEKLSKDELIIELVKARWEKRNLKKVIEDLADNMGSYCLYAPRAKPSDKWAERIADYVLGKDPDAALEEWGVDDATVRKLERERLGKGPGAD
ncbi:MAG: hypothetical protein LKJ94_05700 [Candidatus Methanomethylophilus sp.]|jgi:hypothetical protein|nr:hypothetical protein [Methanomethylophilus sp.]MCI2092516.1 hypothetical protein [Methanomethylophilus sp.]